MNLGAVLNLELYFAGWECLVLHHNCAAAGQDHDVQLLLLLMGLLIPFAGHFCVMSRYQCYLQIGQSKTLIYTMTLINNGFNYFEPFQIFTEIETLTANFVLLINNRICICIASIKYPSN